MADVLPVLVTTLVLVPFMMFVAWLAWLADALWRHWFEVRRRDDEWIR